MRNIAIIFALLTIVLTIAAPVRIARDVPAISSGRSNQRSIVRDSAGYLYVAYDANVGSEIEVFIARSTDDGASWESTWADLTSALSGNHRDPSIAIDSHDTLHIVWRGDIVSGDDADLLYTRYPNPSVTTICTRSGYPGAYCPSLAVGPDDDLHVAWTGCPSSWFIRYARYDRATSSWGPNEDVGPRTPSRWPSVDVDITDIAHVIYRNQYSSHYHAAHRMKDAGAWVGFNGENHDSLDFDDITASVEYSSIFIDSLENIHAVWQWMEAFASNPDSVRYRRYINSISSWSGLKTIYGNGPTDSHINNSGDVVVDDNGYVYIFYHDNDSVMCRVYSDLGATFDRDTVLENNTRARFPNARGSKWPAFNRPQYPCVDFVFTWAHPDSPVVSLMFDEICLEPELIETTEVCAETRVPYDSSFTSCSDQQIDFWIGCCGGGDSTKITSTDSTVEYYDSTSGTWEPALYLDPTPWGTYWVHLDTDSCNWVWSEYPASSSHGDWFRVLVDSDCESIDTAFIRIQVDNQGTIYANGTYIDTTHGNPGTGSTGWRTLHEFDLTDEFHGGVDTVTIMGYNSSGIAGMIFELYVICSSPCCGEIDETTIDFTVDGDHFTVLDPELSWDGDSILSFTPVSPDTFEHGDTVYACVQAVSDTCAGVLRDTVCVTFFVDLEPPVIWGIEPPPDTMTAVLPDSFEFYLIDSIAGLDTGNVVFTVATDAETAYITSPGAGWFFQWSTDSLVYERGDTIEICVTANDTANYCPPNVLDTCWYYFITPCRPLDLSVICPLPCYSFVACSSASIVFEINDTAGFGIDTMNAFFTVIENHPSGLADTSIFESPLPNIIFDFSSDTTVAVWDNWTDGDSVIITLDSLYSMDGCVTKP